MKPITFLRGKVDAENSRHSRPSHVRRRLATAAERSSYSVTDRTEIHYNAIARDHAGKPVIPGSAWKGPFRAAFARAFRKDETGKDIATALFGPPEATADGPIGGRVEFCDATFASDTAATANLPLWHEHSAIEAAVAHDRRTRTASEGKLYYTEFVPAGTQFTGTLTAQGIATDDVRRLVWMLENLATRAQFGAEAGNGWGKVRVEGIKIHHFAAASAFETWKNPERQHATTAGYDACKIAAAPRTLDSVAPKKEPESAARDIEPLMIPITLKFHSPLLVRRSVIPKQSRDESTPDAFPRLTAEDKALLPARSFRGALRSQCERILRTLLESESGSQPVLSPRAPAEAKGQAESPPRVAIARDPSGENLEALHDPRHPETLSLAAQIFGAAGWRATLDCADFISLEKPALTMNPRSGKEEPIEQEFVAIDRFTGGSADGRKFKWQAAWPASGTATMDFTPVTLRLDLARLDKCVVNGCSAKQWAPGLLALALRDLAEGDIAFGAGAGKGYGACTAEIDWLKSEQAAAAVAAFREFVRSLQAAPATVDAIAAPA